MPRTKKLTNLEVFETSGVDNAAHLHDGFLVMKSADENNRVKAQLLQALGKSKEDNLSNENQVELTKAEYEDKIASMEAALDAAQAQAADLAAKLEEISAMQSEGMGEEVEAGYRMKQEHDDKMDAEKMDDEVEMAMHEMDEDVAKSLRELPAVQRLTFAKAFNAQQKEVAKATEEIRKEREIRLDAEAITKSKEEFANVAIDHTTVAPALRRLEAQDEVLAKTVREVLSAADAQISESGIMKEFGTSSTSTANVFDEATALAKALVDNGSAKTIEQGIDMVLTENRDLAKRYYEEANN